MLRIGVDFGGTKIEAIALGPGGTELGRRRIPSPRGDYDAAVAAVAELVTGLEGELGLTGTVGVGIPGTLSPATGLVKNANSVWLNGRPFDRDLSERLGRELRFANDANCFALSEAVDGAGAGFASVFGVILGTGVGGGLVFDGKPLIGANAIAGEWGHNPLPWPGPDEYPGRQCYCGRTGCIETYLSGPGLAHDYAANGGKSVAATEIATRAGDGESIAQQALSRYADRLARSLAMVINIVDPEIIVLGGGLSNINRLIADVPEIWDTYVFSDHVDSKLVAAAHGDSGGVRGAAWLWPEPGGT